MSRSTTGSHGKNWIDRKSKTTGLTTSKPEDGRHAVAQRLRSAEHNWDFSGGCCCCSLAREQYTAGWFSVSSDASFLMATTVSGVSHPSSRLFSNMKQLEMLRLRDSGPIAARKIIWLVTFVCALRQRQRSGRITGWSRRCRTWRYCRIITVVQFGIKIKDCGSKFHQSMGGRGMHDERRAE